MLGIMAFQIKIKTEFLTVFKSVNVFYFSDFHVSVLRYKEHPPPLKPNSRTFLVIFIPPLKSGFTLQRDNIQMILFSLPLYSAVQSQKHISIPYWPCVFWSCLFLISFSQLECFMSISTMADQTHKNHGQLEKKQKVCQDS